MLMEGEWAGKVKSQESSRCGEEGCRRGLVEVSALACRRSPMGHGPAAVALLIAAMGGDIARAVMGDFVLRRVMMREEIDEE